jgi:hypothetical protein
MMASGRDKDDAVEGKDFTWVAAKDSKGNIIKDGKGNAVKTRKFGKNSAPESSPRPQSKPKAQTSSKSAPKPSAGMKSSPRPKARPPAKSTPAVVGVATKAPQVTGKGSGMAGAVGSAVKKGISAMTSGKPAMAPDRSKVAPRSTASNVDANRSGARTGGEALARARKELAMQKDRSAAKSGMTLRERNQP